MDHSLYEVIVAYHDPFNIWDRVQKYMDSILPLPLNANKIHSSHWHKNIYLPYGINGELWEGGSLRCGYVRAEESYHKEISQRILFSNDLPYLHIYVLPPMDYVFFKRCVKAPLKSFISAHKSRGVVVIYGLCNKENKSQQESNCKTIERIRRIFTSMSLSQSRLCLVPMLDIPLFTVDSTPSIERGNDENTDTLSFKNWRSLAVAMGDSISEMLSTRLTDISMVIHRTKSHSLITLTLLYESILRIRVKCGLTQDVIDGYMTLIRQLEPEVKRNIAVQDFERTPFIFYKSSVYTVEDGDNYFDVYQYLCYVLMQLLGHVNSVHNLCRTCHFFMDYCMLTVTLIRRNRWVKHLLWSLTAIMETIFYIYEQMKKICSTSQLHELVSIGELTVQDKTTVNYSVAKDHLSHAENNVKEDIAVGVDIDGQLLFLRTMHDEVPLTNALSSNELVLHRTAQCLHHTNGYKCIHRCIGMLYTFIYKVLKNVDELLSCDALDTVHKVAGDDISYERYRDLESTLLGLVKSSESRIRMLSDAIEKSALSFSHGDLPRFSNLMYSLNSSEDALSFMKKDSGVMGWSLKALSENKPQVFMWLGPHEPNTALKDPLERVKSVITANLHRISNYLDTCLTPCHMEDEAVNDYLRILADAKIDIGKIRFPFNIYGQFVKLDSPTYTFKLNVYSLEEIRNASVCIRLKKDKEQVLEVQENRSYEYENVCLDRTYIRRGLNVMTLGHRFSNSCNYIQDAFLLVGDKISIEQRIHTPIPLGILSNVINVLKSFRIPPQCLLSTIMLPTTFIRRITNDNITIKVSPCSAVMACGNSVLLAGARNFLTFQLSGFKGGKICLLQSSIKYDIGTACLFSNGIHLQFLNRVQRFDGIEMTLPNGRSSNHLICISAELDASLSKDRIYQAVRVYCDSVHDFSLEFLVLPPFCREVTTMADGLLKVTLEPTAPFYTQIDSVTVNGNVFVNASTLLEPGCRFYISIHENAMVGLSAHASSLDCDKSHLFEHRYKENDCEARNKSDFALSCNFVEGYTPVVVASRPVEKSFTIDVSKNTTSTASTSPVNNVAVKYRFLRRRCLHQQISSYMGLETLSGPLDYQFMVPQARASDVVVDYKTPPFCFLNVSFDATIEIHTNKEVSFEYEIETNEHWFVEGPIRGKNQMLHALEALSLRFKMTALDCAGGNLLQLPSIRFWRLRAPVVHKEIFLLNSLDTRL